MKWLRALLYRLADGKERHPVLSGLREGERLLMELNTDQVDQSGNRRIIPCVLTATVKEKFPTRVVVRVSQISYPTAGEQYTVDEFKTLTLKEANLIKAWAFLGPEPKPATKGAPRVN